MKRPRWLDPVVGSDGRRLTLGNWLLTVVLPTLVATPAMVLLGLWLFENLWVPLLDPSHDKYITGFFLPYVMPSISTATFCIFCYIRASRVSISSTIYTSSLVILGFSVSATLNLLLLHIENISLLSQQDNIWLVWATLLFGPITISFLAALGLRNLAIFSVSRISYIVIPFASLLYSAFPPILLLVLSSTPGLVIANYWTMSLSAAAVYAGTGLVAGLAVWLTLRRSRHPDADTSPQQAPLGSDGQRQS